MIKNKKCVICNGKIKFLISRLDKYDYNYCENCSLIIANPFPSNEILEKYYQSFLCRKPNNYDFRYIIEIINKEVIYFIKIIRKYFSNLSNLKILKILDFGGAIGLHSYLLSKYFFDVSLFDFDKEAINYAKKFLNKFINIINIDSKTYLNKKFDIIICNQVIEHNTDLILFLNNLKNLLKKDGILILTTPNQLSYQKFFTFKNTKHYFNVVSKRLTINILVKYLKKSWQYCDPPRHLFSFNSYNLKLLIKKANLKSLKIITKYKYNKIITKNIKKSFLNVFFVIICKFIQFFDYKKIHGNTLISISRKYKIL